MKVHLIKVKTIQEFCIHFPRARSSMDYWLAVIHNVDWKSPNDILKTFGSADLLGKGSHRVVFNIGGNNFRMICKYAFGQKYTHLFVCWIGSHKSYDRLCEKNLQYRISIY